VFVLKARVGCPSGVFVSYMTTSAIPTPGRYLGTPPTRSVKATRLHLSYKELVIGVRKGQG
jgi:hypothetical protein